MLMLPIIQFTILKMLNCLYNLQSTIRGPQMSEENRTMLTLTGSVGHATVNYVATSNVLSSNWKWGYKLITHATYILCLKLIAFDIISVC